LHVISDDIRAESKHPIHAPRHTHVLRKETKMSVEDTQRNEAITTKTKAATYVDAVRGAAKFLLSLTPSGDAMRIWVPTGVALLVQAFVFFTIREPLQYVHMLLATNIFYGLFLALTWGAMRSSMPTDVQRWALAQERTGSRWRRFLEESSGRRVFSGGAGTNTIISFSLAGLFLAVALLPRGEDLGAEPLVALLCVLGVLMSWGLLHTSYAMYYAHLYYRTPSKRGGMEFPGEEEPAALDFAYFAFTIGTAFSTSDVSVSSSKIRRKVLIHSVLAFFYNTTILALVVNLITGFV
jgi:Protein of unknown function (DUF1345)